MAKVLLDYFFPISEIEIVNAASTSFLKNVAVIAKGIAPDEETPAPEAVTVVTSIAQLEGLTENQEIKQLFNAGLNKITLITVNDIEDAALEGLDREAFTLLVSSDFTKVQVAAMDFGAFGGVIGVTSDDTVFLKAQAAIKNRVAFYSSVENKGANMFAAFGKMLSNQLNWRNQQYTSMPKDDGVNSLGQAEALFEDKISFVMNDSEFGLKLSLFAAGGKAIVAPYINRNLQIDLQSKALVYISGNQPAYTVKQAALLEDSLYSVIDQYVERQWIEEGIVEIKLEQSNFIASGYINITEPKALWRIFGEMSQTL